MTEVMPIGLKKNASSINWYGADMLNANRKNTGMSEIIINTTTELLDKHLLKGIKPGEHVLSSEGEFEVVSHLELNGKVKMKVKNIKPVKKTYRCACVYHKGKRVRCEITTDKSEIPILCPYDMGAADWREFKERS